MPGDDGRLLRRPVQLPAMLESDRVFRLALRGVNAYLVRDGAGDGSGAEDGDGDGDGDRDRDRHGDEAGSDDGSWTLVDAGMPWHAGRIRASLDDAGVTPADVDRVLLTHYDLDHVGALATLGLDAPVHAADPDAAYLDGTGKPPLSNHKGLFQRAVGPLVRRPDLPLERVTDGDEVGGFRVVRTPGHTPGHTAFVHDDYGVAFVGDVVMGDDGDLSPSPWYLCYDAAENEASVRALAERAADVDAVCMGHGDPVRTGGGDALERLVVRL
jgi:glyoxylase-like metal-dependent hydrolase (beta-lactamase superfamily II)